MLMVGLVFLGPVIQMSSSIDCLTPCHCHNLFKKYASGWALSALDFKIYNVLCDLIWQSALTPFFSFRNYFLSYI